MVRNKHDDRVFIAAILLQCLEQPPNLVVQMGDTGIIANLRLALQCLVRDAVR